MSDLFETLTHQSALLCFTLVLFQRLIKVTLVLVMVYNVTWLVVAYSAEVTSACISQQPSSPRRKVSVNCQNNVGAGRLTEFMNELVL